MFKKIRKIATTKMFGRLIYGLALIYSMTFRVKVVNESQWMDYLEKGGRVLLCCWHQQFFIGVRLIRRYWAYSMTVMISKSTDGEIASRVAESAKIFPVRGSSSRGGGPALKEMINRLRQHRLALHLLDGPRGPAGEVKPGAIAIADAADAAIVPVHVRADRAWYMRSWDQYMVPKPFARVTVTFCPVRILEPIQSAEDFERQRKLLEDTLLPYLKRRT